MRLKIVLKKGYWQKIQQFKGVVKVTDEEMEELRPVDLMEAFGLVVSRQFKNERRYDDNFTKKINSHEMEKKQKYSQKDQAGKNQFRETFDRKRTQTGCEDKRGQKYKMDKVKGEFYE